MKSLNEQIAEITASNASRASKKEALIKLGLHKDSVDIIMWQLPKETRTRTQRVKFTFGVEIECLVSPQLMRQTADANGLPYAYEGYNHRDNNRYYKFVSDASIRGNNPIECVSPVLQSTNGFASLELCCKSLNEANAQVNKSTGLHVHIGAQSLSDEAYINVFHNYKMLESVIDSIMAKSRRENNSQWCRSLQNISFADCNTKSDVYRAMHGDRYYKVNAVSYSRHKTIEFRQHQGSTDFAKISNWVRFCAKLVEFSKRNKLQAPIASINDIPFLTATEKRFFNQRAEALR